MIYFLLHSSHDSFCLDIIYVSFSLPLSDEQAMKIMDSGKTLRKLKISELKGFDKIAVPVKNWKIGKLANTEKSGAETGKSEKQTQPPKPEDEHIPGECKCLTLS